MNIASLLTTAFIGLILSGCATNEAAMAKQDELYDVGVTVFELSSKSQWIQVHSWYPAKQLTKKGGSAIAMNYTDKWLNEVLAKQYGIPRFLMGVDVSNSWVDIAPVEGQFPVILFNHGWDAFSRSNMAQFEYLAARGFIVMSISHPGDSARIKRIDGSFVDSQTYINRGTSTKPSKDQTNDLVNRYEQLKQAQTPDQFDSLMASLQETELYQPLKSHFETWVTQTEWLMAEVQTNSIEQIPDWLRHNVDVSRIGLMGHSFGGATMGMVAQRSTNRLPTLVFDVPQFNFDLQATNHNQPICYFYSTHTRYGKITLSSEDINHAHILNNQNACEQTFPGTAHLNFTDLTYVTPMKWAKLLGPADNKEFGMKLNKATEAFFNQQLE